MTEETRRRFLRNAGAATVLGLLAGCSREEDPSGTGTRTADGTGVLTTSDVPPTVEDTPGSTDTGTRTDTETGTPTETETVQTATPAEPPIDGEIEGIPPLLTAVNPYYLADQGAINTTPVTEHMEWLTDSALNETFMHDVSFYNRAFGAEKDDVVVQEEDFTGSIKSIYELDGSEMLEAMEGQKKDGGLNENYQGWRLMDLEVPWEELDYNTWDVTAALNTEESLGIAVNHVTLYINDPQQVVRAGVDAFEQPDEDLLYIGSEPVRSMAGVLYNRVEEDLGAEPDRVSVSVYDDTAILEAEGADGEPSVRYDFNPDGSLQG